MTVEDIYNTLYSQPWRSSASVCDIRTVCVVHTTCAEKSVTDVIDFDEYAEQYKQQLGIPERPQSVDAIAIDSTKMYLLMVEKKTWYQFYKYQIKTTDVEETKRLIREKVDEYTREIANKYVRSKDIIAHFTGVTNVVDSVQHVLVFLTELGVDYPDPMGGFATDLALLAMTGSFNKVQYTVNAMQNSVKTFPAPKKKYVFCKQFDGFVHEIKL